MLAKVFGGRQQLIEGMDEWIILQLAASRSIELGVIAVGTIARGPVLVPCLREEGFAIFERRLMCFGEMRHLDRLLPGNMAHLAREPAAAQLIEERVYAVHRSALMAAGDDQVFAGSPDDEPLRPKRLERHAYA